MITLAAVGDIALKGAPEQAIRARGTAWPLTTLQPILERADLRFGNMESVFFPETFPPAELHERALATADDVAGALAGFDVLNLAQNHILDCGTTGLAHTKRVLADMGIATVGAGATREEARAPVIIERGGIRVGILAYQEDCNYTHGHLPEGPAYLLEADILADMTALRPQVDVLVLSIHSDLEFMDTPAVWRKALSHRLAAAGADLILHTHPHVPQGIERVGDCLIAYSLGNCVFDAHGNDYMKRNGPHTAHSFVLSIDLTKAGVDGFRREPFLIDAHGQPVPMVDQRREEGLAYLRWLDEQVVDDAIVQRNWRARCQSMLGEWLEKLQGVNAETFMERYSYVLAGVQENRAWCEELVRMAMERHREQAAAGKPWLAWRRPSWGQENGRQPAP